MNLLVRERNTRVNTTGCNYFGDSVNLLSETMIVAELFLPYIFGIFISRILLRLLLLDVASRRLLKFLETTAEEGETEIECVPTA